MSEVIWDEFENLHKMSYFFIMLMIMLVLDSAFTSLKKRIEVLRRGTEIKQHNLGHSVTKEVTEMGCEALSAPE